MSTEMPPGVFTNAVVVAEAPAKKTRAKRAPASSGSTAITPEKAEELEQRRAAYADMLRHVQQTACATPEEMAWHEHTLRTAKDHFEQLDGQRKEIEEPLKQAQAAVKRLFGPALDFLKSVQAASKLKIEARLAAQASQQAEALRQMQDHQGRVDASVLATATGAELLAVPEGMHTRETWSYEITDASQLPAEFWTPDVAKLEAVAKSQKASAAVPGVRFFATQSLVVRK